MLIVQFITSTDVFSPCTPCFQHRCFGTGLSPVPSRTARRRARHGSSRPSPLAPPGTTAPGVPCAPPLPAALRWRPPRRVCPERHRRGTRVRRGPGRRGGTGAAGEALTAASPPTALAVKFGERQRSPHYLLVKEHQVREAAGAAHPPRRTLFVLNVPPYCGPVSGAGAAGGCGRGSRGAPWSPCGGAGGVEQGLLLYCALGFLFSLCQGRSVEAVRPLRARPVCGCL